MITNLSCTLHEVGHTDLYTVSWPMWTLYGLYVCWLLYVPFSASWWLLFARHSFVMAWAKPSSSIPKYLPVEWTNSSYYTSTIHNLLTCILKPISTSPLWHTLTIQACPEFFPFNISDRITIPHFYVIREEYHWYELLERWTKTIKNLWFSFLFQIFSLLSDKSYITSGSLEKPHFPLRLQLNIFRGIDLMNNLCQITFYFWLSDN